MPKLTLQRIPFSKNADLQMRRLKGKTGITPNHLSRLGFCLSLEEPGIPEAYLRIKEQGREINRFTLLGENDIAFISLLKVWMYENSLNTNIAEEIDNYFIAHMNRGIELMASRVKGLTDIAKLAA